MTSRRYPLLPVLFGIFLVVSCVSGGGGGGGSSVASGGIGGTGVTSTGTITGFGSVFVTENEFQVEVGTGISDDDDANASEDDLRVGMVVTVRGTLNPDGTATADSITFDPNLEGPVSGVQAPNADGTEREMTVLGTTVILSANGTVFDDGPNSAITFGTVSVGMFVEVSGFFDENGKLRATFIERDNNLVFRPSVTEVEAKGTIANYDGSSNFNLVFAPSASLAVTNVAGAALDDLPNDTVTDGLFVEVKGTLNSLIGTTIAAIRIEGEGLDEDEGEVEIEGIVTGFAAGGISNFQVAGQQVDASGASVEPASLVLVDGLEVEVEGVLSGGVLQAREVKLRGGEIKIEATVASGGVDTVAKTITLGPLVISGETLTVTVDSQTQLESESGDPFAPPFGIDDIDDIDGSDGDGLDFLKVEAFDDGSGRLIATEIKRDNEDDVILQGPTDDPVVSILGVPFDTTGLSDNDFENEDDAVIGRGAFFVRAETGGVKCVVTLRMRNGTSQSPFRPRLSRQVFVLRPPCVRHGLRHCAPTPTAPTMA